MSASTTKNASALSNAKTYIIPVLIVIVGIMFAMGNMFSSNAATSLPPQTHTSTTVTAEYHASGTTIGGALGR